MIIALFTDFGTRDAYVAQLKGVILSLHPTVQLIDLTHAVDAFDIRAAAYLLDAAARYFPAGTIFVVRLPYSRPQRVGETITGEVLHLDHFGNIATNIPAAMCTDFAPGQRVACTCADYTQVISFVETYGAGPQDALVCLINSNGEFEIALPHGAASAQLGVKVGERVVVERYGLPV